MRVVQAGFLRALLTLIAIAVALAAAPLSPDATYRPLPTQPFLSVKASDESQKP
jgi:hypothetical protein